MPSATQLIRRDHKSRRAVRQIYPGKKSRWEERICEQVIQESEIHTKLEEEIFIPR